jgi:hypothetical protein
MTAKIKMDWKYITTAIKPVQTALSVCTKMQKCIDSLIPGGHTHNNSRSQYVTSLNKTGRISCLLIQSKLLHPCTSFYSDSIRPFQLVSVLINFVWSHSKKILQILVQLDVKRTSVQKIFSRDYVYYYYYYYYYYLLRLLLTQSQFLIYTANKNKQVFWSFT